jgi:putative transposase
MDRTVRVLLQTTPEQAAALAETLRLFTLSFNAVCAYGWEHGEKNGVHLHHETYTTLKTEYPRLVSDHHIQARVKATEALRSAFVLKRNGKKVSAPHSLACPPRYNVHTYKVNWSDCTIRLSTAMGRMTLPFNVLDYARQYIGGIVATADLIERAGRWWMHIVVSIPSPVVVPTDIVIGVDLGLAQPAVMSNNQFLGERRWREVNARCFRLRRQLQKVGTKSAKRHLRKMRGKQSRFHRNCDHVLSKYIVQATPVGATIVLENLTNIRRTTKSRKGAQSRRLHGWSFAQLRSFIMYKAEARGCTVGGVDPRHTSQTCPKCNFVSRHNRRSRSFFQCRECGYSLHADLVGARNIAAKYLANGGTSATGGLPVNQPIAGDHRGSPASHLN